MASTELIGWFDDIGLADRPTVGGKGGSLGELTRAGIPVPPGFVVRTRAFELFLAALERAAPVRALVQEFPADDLQGITRASERIRRRMAESPLPAELAGELSAALTVLQAGDAQAPLAVRSSATTEDAEDASFAGLQDTSLWVKGAKAVAMAVVIQRMVDARAAGVMFTRSPTTGDRSVVVIEGAWGLGSAVVSGEVTPDRFVVGKVTGEISVREIRDKHQRHVPAPQGGVLEQETPAELREAPCLSDEDIQRLREMARRIERHYGRPQDIEWALDQQGGLRILQSRPETVWAARDAAPVAEVRDNPLHHVMSVFGGRR